MKKYILFVDSGLGGINLLAESVKIMPHENFIYFADTKNLPLGNKSKFKIRKIICKILKRQIKKHRIKMVVFACNTATAAAVKYARKKFKLPIVGIEPAIKKAADKCSARGADKNILLIATKATVKHSEIVKKYKNLKNINIIKDKNLAKLIDDNLSGKIIEDYILKTYGKYAGADAVVLGCTHYIFALDSFKKCFKNARFFESSIYVARRIKQVLLNNKEYNRAGQGEVLFCESGHTDKLEKFKKVYYELRLRG